MSAPASRPGSTALIALFVLLAFASNSILCRMALRETRIDPASFTSVRLLTGALTMVLLVRFGRRSRVLGGDWRSAAVLLLYAVTFSFAYVSVTTGTGALLLFGAVQLIMISVGMMSGERIDVRIGIGWTVAVTGLVLLLMPGIAAPPLGKALLMLCAGVCWGLYSLLGRRSGDPLCDTAGNFVRAAPGAVLVSALLWRHTSIDSSGVMLAALSGSIASGVGYVAWYTVLPRLSAIAAANMQLSVPVIAALGGVALSGESITWRLAVSSALVLGGIALATRQSYQAVRRRAAAP
ncbi:MAG TPA: DMT family transporter [Steroidobacteraceae bacterium]